MFTSLWVDPFVEIVNDGREGFLGLFVQVRNSYPSGEDGIVRVLGGEVGGGLGGKILSDVSWSVSITSDLQLTSNSTVVYVQNQRESTCLDVTLHSRIHCGYQRPLSW